MNPLAGFAAIIGAVALGNAGREKAIKFWISPSNTHWAVVSIGRVGPWNWIDENGNRVKLISANLRDDGRGGMDVIDERWDERADNYGEWQHPEAPRAVKRFKLTPAPKGVY